MVKAVLVAMEVRSLKAVVMAVQVAMVVVLGAGIERIKGSAGYGRGGGYE